MSASDPDRSGGVGDALHDPTTEDSRGGQGYPGPEEGAQDFPLETYVLSVNGTAHEVADAGWARACSTCCASGSGCRLPRAHASRASAVRAASSSTASWSARASCWRPRPSAGDRHRSKAWPPAASSTDVQQAFVDAGAVQCGFCTPGPDHGRARPARSQRREPTEPEIREELSGNICRCTGYGRIIDAVAQRGGAGRRAALTHDAIVTAPTPGAGGARRQPDAARRRAQGAGLVRLLVRPLADGMLWGATLRSPAPLRAHRRRSTSSAALAIAGVDAVITADDVPGRS